MNWKCVDLQREWKGFDSILNRWRWVLQHQHQLHFHRVWIPMWLGEAMDPATSNSPTTNPISHQNPFPAPSSDSEGFFFFLVTINYKGRLCQLFHIFKSSPIPLPSSYMPMPPNYENIGPKI